MPLCNINVTITISVSLVNDFKHVLITDQLRFLRVDLFESPHDIILPQAPVTVFVKLLEY
jgi:hypothetical protein